jgi:hypothetical protein
MAGSEAEMAKERNAQLQIVPANDVLCNVLIMAMETNPQNNV